MDIEVTPAGPDSVAADLVAASGRWALELGAPDRAVADADPVAMVYRDSRAPLAVVALEPDVDGVRTAAARAVRACRDGGIIAWAFDPVLPVAPHEQVRALAEGAVIGGYDGRRWRSGDPPRGVERFVICGASKQLAPVADRAALVAHWTNVARELVDAPANLMSPADLSDRVVKFTHLDSEIIVDPARSGLGALAAVGASSPISPGRGRFTRATAG